jgi:hypothetical protein
MFAGASFVLSETTMPVYHKTQRYRFFVFTCRDPKSDFRLPLVNALRQHYETYYIWLRRRPVVTGPNTGAAPAQMSLTEFFRWIWHFKRDSKVNFYFNSTNTSFPGLMVLLRLIANSGIWCLDMHDDLRYHYKSFKRFRTRLGIATMRAASDVMVHAAPTLQELFPRSRRLGNASHVRPVEYHGTDKNAVSVLASFDERFDFEFLVQVARLCPWLQFHLHGWTRRDDPGTLQRIETMTGRYANIHYHGLYTTDDLPAILGAYRVSLAPYRTDSLLTRYIEPLRFYHCLNAGLEVVSTDIPQARFMQHYIHVVPDATACASIMAELRSGKSAKQPAYSPVTWDLRVDRLVEILTALPRTKALETNRSVKSDMPIAEFEAGRD